ncbi:hypothetical protein BD289DRAFT_464087 [Coniella lustricola]|uniref:Protein kinase domain-containing protein n=1 Tax=Coniella lustricola TaxID=2025994 RepID=A0A2T2ZSE0_9PEZI|nr:hypothetical protein BD289DRAFT_464087 [Coniella lustricola]
MEIYNQSEAFVDEEGDLVFDYTKVILKASEDEFFFARIPHRLKTPPDIDFGAHDLTKIPVDDPNLLCYGDTNASFKLAEQILNEAEVHGRIRGLCFVKYPLSLFEQIQKKMPLNIRFCVQEIKKGVAHLHRLGLIHNNLNPSNIMMDAAKPVIIDFDSCKQVGKKLGLKAGTIGWEKPGITTAEPENDDYSIARLEE